MIIRQKSGIRGRALPRERVVALRSPGGMAKPSISMAGFATFKAFDEAGREYHARVSFQELREALEAIPAPTIRNRLADLPYGGPAYWVRVVRAALADPANPPLESFSHDDP
jgi:hypothetical protein